MKSYNKPKGEAHWGDPKGKAKGKGKDPKGKGKESKGKGDPAGKGPGPYSNAAGDGPAGQHEPPYQSQTEHDNGSWTQTSQEQGWEENQSGWQEADWTGTQWYESGFAAHQQQPLAADRSDVSWRHNSYFYELVGIFAGRASTRLSLVFSQGCRGNQSSSESLVCYLGYWLYEVNGFQASH